jgi:hypothetical protein
MNPLMPHPYKPFSVVTLNAVFVAAICTLFTLRSLNVFDTSDWSAVHFAYWGAFALTNFFLLSWIPGLLLGWLPLKLNLRKTGFVLLALFNGLLLSWALADTFVFEQFRLHINLAMVQMTLFGGGQIVPVSAAVYLKSTLLIGLCFVFGALCIRAASKITRKTKSSAFAFLLVILWLFCMIWSGFAYATHKAAYLESEEIIPATKVLHFNKLLLKLHLISEEDIYAPVKDNGGKAKKFNYPQSPLTFKDAAKPNIVLILVDSLRYDMLAQETMPKLSAFAKDNIVFNDHWSGGINTRHGVFTLFTGIPGSYWFKSLATNSSSALIDALQKQDYRIGIFAGAPLTMPEFNQTIFAKIPNLRLESKGSTIIEKDDNAVRDFESFVKKEKTSQPFFGFVFFDNVHATEFPSDGRKQPFKPYWEKVDHMKLGPDFDPKPYFNRYKNAVRHADENIAKILDFLKKENLLDNTVVIISSDHGEEFNDNGQNYWQHNGNFTKYQAKIPLVIHWPGKPAQTVNYRTSALDIVPTVLPELLGCTTPAQDYSSGRSLWDSSRRPFVYISNYSRNAFVEPDRINQIDEKGLFLITDNDNRKIKDAKPDAGHLQEFFRETTRFYK